MFIFLTVDIQHLIQKYLKSKCPIGDALRIGYRTNEHSSWLVAAILQKRILKPDCLGNGYVIVGFPTNLKEIQIVMENFINPPNK